MEYTRTSINRLMTNFFNDEWQRKPIENIDIFLDAFWKHYDQDAHDLGELYDLLDEVSPNQRNTSRVFRLLVLNGVSNIDILASWDTDKLNEFVKNAKYIGKDRRKILEDAVLKAKAKVCIDN